jgi:hypothetical protein
MGRWAPCLVSHHGLTLRGEGEWVNGLPRAKFSLGRFFLSCDGMMRDFLCLRFWLVYLLKKNLSPRRRDPTSTPAPTGRPVKAEGIFI